MRLGARGSAVCLWTIGEEGCRAEESHYDEEPAFWDNCGICGRPRRFWSEVLVVDLWEEGGAWALGGREMLTG